MGLGQFHKTIRTTKYFAHRRVKVEASTFVDPDPIRRAKKALLAYINRPNEISFSIRPNAWRIDWSLVLDSWF
jgi:hypothetical protein